MATQTYAEKSSQAPDQNTEATVSAEQDAAQREHFQEVREDAEVILAKTTNLLEDIDWVLFTASYAIQKS